MVKAVAEQFFKGKVAYGRTLTRTGKPVTIAFDWIELVKLKQELEGTGTYRRPGRGAGERRQAPAAASSSPGMLQSQGRATVVGQISCGCLLALPGLCRRPGGGKLAYSEVAFEFANGKRIEGEGVVPDVAGAGDRGGPARRIAIARSRRRRSA